MRPDGLILLIRALWGMARPLILVSVVLVYLTGILMGTAASGQSPIAPIIAGLAALLLVSISIHYTNEYADFETDSRTRRTPFSGGSGVLPRGLVKPIVALRAAWVTLIVGLVVGAFTLSFPSLVLLVVGAFFGWMYSLPPLRLAWHGWGELDNAVLGGTVLLLYAYSVVTGRIDSAAVLACVPFTLLVFVNLLATTWADRIADAAVGKRTLATRVSAFRLRQLYGGVMVAAFALLILLPPEVALLSLTALPASVIGCLTYTRLPTPAPTVFAMLLMLVAQMGGWALLCLG